MIQDFMPLSSENRIKYSHTATSTSQELPIGMTVVCFTDLEKKL